MSIKNNTIDLTTFSYEDRNKGSLVSKLNFLKKYKTLLDYEINEDNKQVEVIYTNDNKEINVIYKYVDSEKVYELLNNDEDVDLSFCFIDRFNLSTANYQSLNNFKAFSSVWHTEASFECLEAKDSTIDFNFSRFYCSTSFTSSVLTNCNVSFENTLTYSGTFDFRECNVEKGKFTLESSEFLNNNINFSKTVFNVDVNFKSIEFVNGYIHFDEVQFLGDVTDFSYTNFGDKLIKFSKTVFKSNSTSFDNAKFGSSVKGFKGTKLLGKKVSFEFTEFGEGTIYINEVICKSNIKFKYARINSDNFHIDQSTFNNCKVIFLLCTFNTSQFEIVETNFNNAYLEFDSCSMENTKINFSDVSLSGLKFEKIYFHKDLILNLNEVKELTFKDCNIKSDVIMDKKAVRTINDENIIYKKLSFENTKVTGNIYVEWEKNKVYEAIEKAICERIENNTEKDYNPTNDRMYQYRMLKNNFNRIGYYEDEDKALVNFMDNYLLLSKGKWSKVVKCTFSKIGGYGTDPKSIIMWAMVVIGVFAVLYMWVGIDYGSKAKILTIPEELKGSPTLACLLTLLNKFFIALYFSGITFLTIGYGDTSPANSIGMVFAIFEGFLGVFIMSYFSVAVIRKILR